MKITDVNHHGEFTVFMSNDDVEFLDDILRQVEDYAHGEEGMKVTEWRKELLKFLYKTKQQ